VSLSSSAKNKEFIELAAPNLAYQRGFLVNSEMTLSFTGFSFVFGAFLNEAL
jgi:hypothetical protein